MTWNTILNIALWIISIIIIAVIIIVECQQVSDMVILCLNHSNMLSISKILVSRCQVFPITNLFLSTRKVNTSAITWLTQGLMLHDVDSHKLLNEHIHGQNDLERSVARMRYKHSCQITWNHSCSRLKWLQVKPFTQMWLWSGRQ